MDDETVSLVVANIGLLNERLTRLEQQVKALALYVNMTDVGSSLALMQKGTLTPQEIASSALRLLEAVQSDPDLSPVLVLAQGRNELFARIAAAPTTVNEAVPAEAESLALQFLQRWASETKH